MQGRRRRVCLCVTALFVGVAGASRRQLVDRGPGHQLPRDNAAVRIRQVDTDSVVGGYDIRVCRGGRCSTDEDSGVLVLLYVDLEPALATASQLAVSRPLSNPFGADSAPYRTGCFALRRTVSGPETYAGDGRGGHMIWEYDARTGRIWLDPGRSPDAVYEVKGRLKHQVMNGIGRSFGHFTGALSGQADSIVGHRMGPTDSLPCVRAYLGYDKGGLSK